MNAITREGFTGQTVLGDMGLNHMNGRIEDAAAGVFLSADSYVTQPGNTQAFSRYAYVYNNPLSYADPSGFGPCFQPLITTFQPTLTWDMGLPVVGGRYTSNYGATICLPDLAGPNIPPPSSPGSITQYIQPLKFNFPQPQEGHDYRAQNLVCNRPLTTQEQGDLISRFTVPNSYTLGQPKAPGTYMVAAWGIPGGWVNTTFTPDGLAGTNTTTPFHVFTGVVQRSITNTSNGAYMLTHGTGGYSSLPQSQSPSASLETGFSVDIGGALDVINDATGPIIFNNVDQAAAAYAKANFAGC
jgi:RHS repeat-associated protein